MVNRDLAPKLGGASYFPIDPFEEVREKNEKHSVPSTFAKDILSDMIRLAKNNYLGRRSG